MEKSFSLPMSSVLNAGHVGRMMDEAMHEVIDGLFESPLDNHGTTNARSSRCCLFAQSAHSECDESKQPGATIIGQADSQQQQSVFDDVMMRESFLPSPTE
ncbi:hypothetical protein HDU85_001245, partial [Gaertneriomyces sp. JEL0708]